MVEVARIRVKLEGLDKTRDQKARAEPAAESGAAKRRREAKADRAKQTRDDRRKVADARKRRQRIGRRAGRAVSAAGRAGSPGAVAGAAQGLGGGVAGAILSRGPIIAAGIAAAQLVATFDPLIKEGIREALGPELGRIVGVPVEEFAALIRAMQTKFAASISGIGDVNDLVTDLNNAGGNIFDALKKDPAAVARAYDFGETITSADKDIEKTFSDEESARRLLANAETATVLARELAAVLLKDSAFLTKLTDWLRKVTK